MNYAISSGPDQALIVDKLKSAGAEVIQSSRGLVCKSDLSIEALRKLLGAESCTVEVVTDVEGESPDVRKFLG